MTIHPSAQQGYSAKADTYQQGRPSYPSIVNDWLKTELGLKKGTRVLDLGSGTGKFLPYLLDSGASVNAVEPVTAMQQQLRLLYPQVEAKQGTAEAIPYPDRTFDAVICAQSFHWFTNQRALAEICRVLTPQGKLGLIWNVRDESVDWVAAIEALQEPLRGDTPAYRSKIWQKLFPNQWFGELTLTTTSNNHYGSFDDVIIKRILSVSFIAKLPVNKQDELIETAKQMLTQQFKLSETDPCCFPYVTNMYVTQKLKNY